MMALVIRSPTRNITASTQNIIHCLLPFRGAQLSCSVAILSFARIQGDYFTQSASLKQSSTVLHPRCWMDMDTQNNGIGTNWLSTERDSTVPGPSQRVPLLTHEPQNYMAVAMEKDPEAAQTPNSLNGSAEVEWPLFSSILGSPLTLPPLVSFQQVNPETVVPALSYEGANSLEAGSATTLPHDPYQLSNGILSEDELAGLRLRRKGKRLASHQIRQNQVTAGSLCFPEMLC